MFALPRVDTNEQLRQLVEELLAQWRSPEQISRRSCEVRQGSYQSGLRLSVSGAVGFQPG
jgi:IS30 family transposase